MKLKPRNTDEGFTLIELLVVIIIIGILSAIALPSFLNQANKARQSEAKQYVGTLNRVQQVYYLEHSEFASSLTELANPVPSQTDNYSYTIAHSDLDVVNYGTSRSRSLKSYVGMVAVWSVQDSGDATTGAVLCEAQSPGDGEAVNPTAPNGTSNRPSCSDGTVPL